MELSESDRLKWAARRFVARLREPVIDLGPGASPEDVETFRQYWREITSSLGERSSDE